MTHEEYIKQLEKLKANAEKAVVSQLPDIEKQASQLLRDYIDDNLDTKNGDFVVNDRAIAALHNFSDVYTTALTELKDYKGSVSNYLKNFKDIGTLQTDFQKAQGIDVKKATIGKTQELVIAEILNKYTENGLNEGFVQPLRELLYNSVTGGMNKKQAMAQLQAYIESGKDETGKLHRYLEQTAQQGVDSYTGAVNLRIMEEFKISQYVMSGSLIETSSPQCRHAINELGGIIERKDWPHLVDMAKENGLIEGTTFENLPLNKLHWGCRHEFSPVVMTEKQKEKAKETPTNQAPENKPIAPRSNKPEKIHEPIKGAVDLTVLLDDSDFKHALKQTEFYYKERKNEFPGITAEEWASVGEYSGSGYIMLNQHLRNPELTKDVKAATYHNEFEKILNDGLSKVDNFKGTVYRGLDLKPEQIQRYVKAMETGRPVIEYGFTSTSYDVKKYFSGKDVTMIIDSKRGKNIERISLAPREKEVLFKSRSKFKVESVKKEGGKTVIRMTEL